MFSWLVWHEFDSDEDVVARCDAMADGRDMDGLERALTGRERDTGIDCGLAVEKSEGLPPANCWVRLRSLGMSQGTFIISRRVCSSWRRSWEDWREIPESEPRTFRFRSARESRTPVLPPAADL